MWIENYFYSNKHRSPIARAGAAATHDGRAGGLVQEHQDDGRMPRGRARERGERLVHLVRHQEEGRARARRQVQPLVAPPHGTFSLLPPPWPLLDDARSRVQLKPFDPRSFMFFQMGFVLNYSTLFQPLPK